MARTLVFDKNSSREYIEKTLQDNNDANELRLENCKQFTSDGFQAFVKLINPELTSLIVNGSCVLNNSVLTQLVQCCVHLLSLKLCGILKGITSEGIVTVFKNCQQLKSFSISFCESDDSEDEISEEDDSTISGDDLLLALSATEQESLNVSLEHFGFCGFDGITFHGLKYFLEKIKHSLISLDLSELSCINDNTLTTIGEICPKLTTVAFSYCKLTDAAVKEFCVKCKLLQSVDVSGCEELTNEAIIAIARNCRSLKKIYFAWCLNITETAFEELPRNCQELEIVDASQCNIRHIPLQLARLSSLQELRVDGCSCLICPPLNVVEKGLEAMRAFLQECHVESRCRVAFIGNKSSGKSSLVLSLPTLALAVSDAGTEGVHAEIWQPFHNLPDNSELSKFMQGADEKIKDVSVELWDCGGRKCFHNIHPLFLKKETLYVIMFDINKPEDLNSVPYWIHMVQTKSPGAPFIVVGSHADDDDDYRDKVEHVLNSIRTAKQTYYQVIEQELAMLKEIAQDKCVDNRIHKLTHIIERQSTVPLQVFLVSTIKGKGVAAVQKEVVRLIVDKETFPRLHQDVGVGVRYLNAEILRLRKEHTLIVPWENYLRMASDAGIVDDEAVWKATEFLERKGTIIVFNLASVCEDECSSRVVCTNPAGLLNHIACIHTELDPREYVPRFVKSGYLEKYWPSKTKPNEWTLRSAIDDIVSKGLIRESAIPICFQAVHICTQVDGEYVCSRQAAHLKEDEVLKLLDLLRKLGVLVEGAPKGSYEVELVLAYYKNLSVFKRYYLPFQEKLPVTPQNLAKVWPSPASENCVQVAWQYRFPDPVSADSSTIMIGACRNFKRLCDINCYWQNGIVLGVGNVLVRISREGTNLDVTGRCEVRNGSKQALNMTWYVLAQFLYVIETHLSNYPGLCPEVSVPIEGCNSPKRKSRCELIQDYNLRASHLANYRWFLPPAGLDPEDHDKIPADICSWLSLIARKSTIYISYDVEHQNEVKLLCNYFDYAGFDCMGEWALTAHGQELTENRKQTVMRSSLLIAFVTRKYLETVRALQEVKLALDNNKTVIAAVFHSQSTWPPETELIQLLTDPRNHVLLVDLSAGSGAALSHQYNQGQVDGLINSCKDILYGTGDIHPREPPGSPDSSPLRAESSGELGLEDSSFSQPGSETGEKQKKKSLVHFAEEKMDTKPNTHLDEETKQIKRMAASTVAAAVAGATAQHISKSNNSPAGIKAAAAAAEVAQAVIDGDSDAASQAVVRVAKIVNDESNAVRGRVVQNGTSATPPKSTTCNIL